MTAWDRLDGVVTLPGGATVRGRSLRRPPPSPADLTLMLAPADPPPWEHRRIRWPDFWLPTDRQDALAALTEALHRARNGQRIEVGCAGGIGRTGTALAALAVLDGLPAAEAVPWVRRAYHPRAVETPWQRWWIGRLNATPGSAG
ncbi:MAG: protein-tyrosine phosphatase family protein [Kineosporiaceae bacterium]